jgi:hypothetical protein
MRHFTISFILAICWATSYGAGDSLAQIRFDLNAAPKPMEIEAIAGEPFGVGRITFELPQTMLPEPLGIDGLGLSEQNGRALYPTLDNPAFGKVMKEILGGNTPLTTGGPVRQQVGGILRDLLDRPPRCTLYFLFRDADPLELTLDARGPIPLSVVPRNDPAAHRRLLQKWWQQYAKPSSLLEPTPDYPPLVEQYVMSTLARRLNLPLPEEKQTASAYAELGHEVGFNLGTESLRVSMMQDRILGLNNLAQPADQPLPEPMQAPALEIPEPPADVKIEPMAYRVPQECFYARFGSFANFLWMQDTLAQWGGDVQNLIAMRGLDRGLSSRMEKQLVLKQTALSRMLGDTVVADVAIIGTDLFFREGASYGILFQAKSNLALSASLNQQRQERLGAGGVTEEKIKISGREVSYLTSPDGVVRSYYVVDGDFHFITTSKKLVERFLFTKISGEGGLGHSKEFRHARTVMPLGRNDTIWLYVSDVFFRNLTSPFFRIEMARRLQAASDIELVELAQLAAKAEDKPGETIDQLKAANLLPTEFGPLPDGSHVVLEDGLIYDSLRGRLGAFVPLMDNAFGKITHAELSEYNKFAEYYRTHWGRMDPMIAAVKRTAMDGNREHVTVDVLMSPFAPEHFDALRQWLGPADDQRMASIPGDMAALDVVLKDQRIFAGLRDLGRPPSAGLASWLPTGKLRDFFVGYIGTTGDVGLLGALNLGIPAVSDAAGYARSPLNGWRRQYEQFTVFSFQREVLDEVVPQLRFEKAQRPAQIRLRVEDVSHARMTPALNDLLYARTQATSLGNLRLLHDLAQQLHVPAAECKTVAERLLDAKLVCPLGGEYVLHEDGKTSPQWTSSKPAKPSSQPVGMMGVSAPEGFVAPPLSWFRGLNLDATMTEKTISAHAEVLMQMPVK